MEDEKFARNVVNLRMEASKRAEAMLRQMGEVADADLLRSLRLGYRSAVLTAKNLYRDNMNLRRQQPEQEKS